MPRAHTFVLLLLATLWSACRLTDQGDAEVGPDNINFPVSGHEQVDPAKLPAITFDDPVFDMGAVVQGNRVEHRFRFRNTGRSPLVISDVRGSCGCTVGKDWPKTPVKPGEGGEILVTYDSAGRSGVENKTVTVVANTAPPTTILTVRGEVVGPKNVQPVE
jgi:hypothetical protein